MIITGETIGYTMALIVAILGSGLLGYMIGIREEYQRTTKQKEGKN